MPEFCVPIEVWFDADDQAHADDIVERMGDAVADFDGVRAVANGPAEEQS